MTGGCHSVFGRGRANYNSSLPLQYLPAADRSGVFGIGRVPRTALNIKGQFKTFESTGGSGKPTHLHFCGDCASPIFNEVDAFPDVAWIKAGTLDDRSQLHPTLELWCEAAQPWSRQPTQMQSFERMPG